MSRRLLPTTLAFMLLTILGTKLAEASMVMEIDTKFSGSPGSFSPPLLATFTDLGTDQVQLVLSVNNAQQGTKSPAVQQWWFNLTEALEPQLGSLTLSLTGWTGTWDTGAFSTSVASPGSTNTAFKPDGDGFFDFFFTFSSDTNDPTKAFDEGDTATILIQGIAGLNWSSFNHTSESGGGSASDLLSAVRVDGVSGEWWADLQSDTPPSSPNGIPEPASFLAWGLLGILFNCGRLRWRMPLRRSK